MPFAAIHHSAPQDMLRKADNTFVKDHRLAKGALEAVSRCCNCSRNPLHLAFGLNHERHQIGDGGGEPLLST